jgi:hypothetical protein
MLFSREVIKQAQRHIPAHGNNRKDRRFAGGVGAANPKPAAAPLVPKKIGGEINLLLFIRTTVANSRRPIS